MRRNCLIFIALISMGVACGPAVADEPAWSWQEQEGSIALTHGDHVVWRFRYGPDEPKSHFHPVALPDGRVLTWNQPPDHPWHHALWFSWKFLNGVNYWEPNRDSGQPEGRTDIVRVKETLRSDHTARIELDLSYRPQRGAIVLTEQRIVEVSCPDDSGRYHFDWTCTFTAGDADVTFGRTPLPGEPGGKAWGGYAGLSVRFAQELAEREATTIDGPVDFEQESRHRSKANAMDYSGLIDGRPAGIAICDHPKNLNHPTPWYAIRAQPMSYFSPAVICYGPHTLKAGQSFVLRYRVIVHPDRWDTEKLNVEHRRYLRDTESGGGTDDGS